MRRRRGSEDESPSPRRRRERTVSRICWWAVGGVVAVLLAAAVLLQSVLMYVLFFHSDGNAVLPAVLPFEKTLVPEWKTQPFSTRSAPAFTLTFAGHHPRLSASNGRKGSPGDAGPGGLADDADGAATTGPGPLGPLTAAVFSILRAIDAWAAPRNARTIPGQVRDDGPPPKPVVAALETALALLEKWVPASAFPTASLEPSLETARDRGTWSSDAGIGGRQTKQSVLPTDSQGGIAQLLLGKDARGLISQLDLLLVERSDRANGCADGFASQADDAGIHLDAAPAACAVSCETAALSHFTFNQASVAQLQKQALVARLHAHLLSMRAPKVDAWGATVASPSSPSGAVVAARAAVASKSAMETLPTTAPSSLRAPSPVAVEPRFPRRVLSPDSSAFLVATDDEGTVVLVHAETQEERVSYWAEHRANGVARKAELAGNSRVTALAVHKQYTAYARLSDPALFRLAWWAGDEADRLTTQRGPLGTDPMAPDQVCWRVVTSLAATPLQSGELLLAASVIEGHAVVRSAQPSNALPRQPEVMRTTDQVHWVLRLFRIRLPISNDSDGSPILKSFVADAAGSWVLPVKQFSVPSNLNSALAQVLTDEAPAVALVPVAHEARTTRPTKTARRIRAVLGLKNNRVTFAVGTLICPAAAAASECVLEGPLVSAPPGTGPPVGSDPLLAFPRGGGKTVWGVRDGVGGDDDGGRVRMHAITVAAALDGDSVPWVTAIPLDSKDLAAVVAQNMLADANSTGDPQLIGNAARATVEAAAEARPVFAVLARNWQWILVTVSERVDLPKRWKIITMCRMLAALPEVQVLLLQLALILVVLSRRRGSMALYHQGPGPARLAPDPP